jgi:hypothetical protein
MQRCKSSHRTTQIIVSLQIRGNREDSLSIFPSICKIHISLFFIADKFNTFYTELVQLQFYLIFYFKNHIQIKLSKHNY